MKKTFTTLLISTALMRVLPITSVATAQDQPIDDNRQMITSWNQRTVEEIRKALQRLTDNNEEVYIIQWGDTLRSISEATGISVADLAQINQIANPDLIIAGAELRFNYRNQTVTYREGNEQVVMPLSEMPQTVQVDRQEENVLGLLPAQDFEVEEESSVDLPLAPSIEEEVTTSSDASVESSELVALTTESVESTLATETVPTYEAETLEVIETTQAPTTTSLEWTPETSEDQIIETTATSMETTWEPTTTSLETTVTTLAPAPIETTLAPSNHTSSDPYSAFERIVADKGVSAAEKEAWAALIVRESGWNQYAKNAYSGAYGLPQALPGSKMASHGADWQTNPYTQLAWMYDYMVGRYGSISGAWAHSQSVGWY